MCSLYINLKLYERNKRHVSLNAYNPQMANKGKSLEDLLSYQNNQYKSMGIANIQKISTPWTVIRMGKKIVSAFPQGKSTLDFRGTVRGGIPISFDAKESQNEKGLPLDHIQEHQIEYIRFALPLGEVSFVICEIKPMQKIYLIRGEDVISFWDRWKANRRKRGYNIIPISAMQEIIQGFHGYACDYLSVVLNS